MRVEHFGGDAVVDSEDRLAEILEVRFEPGVNEFWLSGTEDGPCLSILIRDDYASLHYFASRGDAGAVCQSDGSAGPAAGAVSFRTNSPEEEIEVSAKLVVGVNTAKKAALEFFRSRHRPKSLTWVDL